MKSNDTIVKFFKAAENNDIDQVLQLVKEQKVDINSKDSENEDRTVLHVAALKGYEHLVHVLVDECGANINIRDNFGEVPLHIAADNHHIQIVKYLVEKGSAYKEDVVDIIGDKGNSLEESSS
jgi:ankyrin repeat protein